MFRIFFSAPYIKKIILQGPLSEPEKKQCPLKSFEDVKQIDMVIHIILISSG